ncbi:30S ribosomal protein S7 [Patescibacteria group bacterium AH-259-L05]|nr:30S ribosomal protein S7 [Patescibacteria group bacterium AH-259-L05]
MRGKQIPKRKITPDPQYGLVEVAKFINYIMRKGKKSLAANIVYTSFDLIHKKTKKDPLTVFRKAIENVSPSLEVRSRRIGGANYQIPMRTNENRRFILASRWIINAAKSKKGKAMSEKLAQELINASLGEGDAIKKKQDVHRMAEANKAFAHFARY